MQASPIFTDDHLRFRETIREFAEQVIRPTARRFDAESRFPWDNVKQMADLGPLRHSVAEALGGSGMDYLSYITVIHELAKVDASHSITVSAHTTLGTSPIMDFGTDEQQRRYVPLLAAGKVLGGFGLTEPSAGSDAGGTQTTAVDKGDHYVLNGSKIFITHARRRRDLRRDGPHRSRGQGTQGITAFIVTKDTCDLDETSRVGHRPRRRTSQDARASRAGKKEDKLGWRASDTRELVFQDAIVPKENVLRRR